MKTPPTIGELGRDDVKLFACPICKRTGYSAAGLKNHRCPSLPLVGGRRQRLDAALVNGILDAGTKPAPLITAFTWYAEADKPDCDISVMIYAPDPKESEDVWPGYWDGQAWYWADGSSVKEGTVKLWGHIPHPDDQQFPGKEGK